MEPVLRHDKAEVHGCVATGLYNRPRSVHHTNKHKIIKEKSICSC